MSINIYAISGSPCAWRVLLGLTFKRLEYQVHYLSLSEKENKSESYLNINPRGTVPALVSGTTTIKDSIAILAWLDRVYPDIPLFGHRPEQAAHIWQITMEASEYFRIANKALLLPIFFRGAESINEELEQAAEIQRAELKTLEQWLGEHDFIGKNYPCAADAVCFPEVCLLKRAMQTHPVLMGNLGFKKELSDFPRVSAWAARLDKFPNVNHTMPPHWLL